MFRVSRLLSVLVVLGAIWFFWPFGKYEDAITVEPAQPDSRQGQLFTKPLSTDAASQKPAATRSTGEANAGPDTTVAAINGDAAEPSAAPQLALKRFYRVVVKDGGSFQAGATTITLAGIDVGGLTAECTDSRGQAWPCGRSARSALMRRIRGRAVACPVPVSGHADTLTARCTVGGKDLSFWMVAHGWAKLQQPAEAAFQEAEDAARERRLGIWR